MEFSFWSGLSERGQLAPDVNSTTSAAYFGGRGGTHVHRWTTLSGPGVGSGTLGMSRAAVRWMRDGRNSPAVSPAVRGLWQKTVEFAEVNIAEMITADNLFSEAEKQICAEKVTKIAFVQLLPATREKNSGAGNSLHPNRHRATVGGAIRIR